MCTAPSRFRRAGFTLVEILVSGAVSSAVGLAVFAFMNAGMFLTAKNLSLNFTSNQMRTTLDRVEQVLQQGDTNPVLITTTGAAAGSGPAAGVKFDRFLGSPYVVSAPPSGLPATTTSLVITRSTDLAVEPPLPRIGDVVRIDTGGAALRPRAAVVAAGAVDATLKRQSITVTLTAPLGTDVPYLSSGVLAAKVVCNVAFIVMPNGARQELRFYDSFENVTSLNDPTRYLVVTDQIGTQASDTTPFSLTSISGKPFVNFSLRVRAGNYDRRLAGKQSDEFNTFSRVETFIRPKANP